MPLEAPLGVVYDILFFCCHFEVNKAFDDKKWLSNSILSIYVYSIIIDVQPKQLPGSSGCTRFVRQQIAFCSLVATGLC